MTTALILILLLAVLGGYLYLRNPPAAGRANGHSGHGLKEVAKPRPEIDKTFRSVGIDAAVNCCQQAKNAAGQRYLIKQAPRLPISGCSAGECNCKYIHFADRRGNEYDRRGLGLIKKSMVSAGDDGERRERKGRRKADL
jgi:hypothetical protein